MNKSEQLIACLEGEIAKRDEVIVGLTNSRDFWREKAIVADEELAACRVAVENCEVFRARIVELENIVDKAWNRSHQLELGAYIPGALDAWKRPVLQNLPYDFSGNPGAPATQYCNGWNDAGGYWKAHVDDLLAELSALKAQEPVAWAATARKKGVTDQRSFWHGEAAADEWISHYIGRGCDVTKTPLYAAPVSEAKAQGVVMPEQDGSDAQKSFWAGFEAAKIGLAHWNIRAAWNEFKSSEQFKRLNAAPVQQVSVPACVTCCDVGIVGHSMLCPECNSPSAAPSAPAADAGDIVLNASAQEILSQCIGAHAYVLGVLANGRPDLAFTEAKKWVDAFKKAATQMEPGHD